MLPELAACCGRALCCFAVPYATCQAPYDTFSFVTKIRVCRDTDGFITGTEQGWSSKLSEWVKHCAIQATVCKQQMFHTLEAACNA